MSAIDHEAAYVNAGTLYAARDKALDEAREFFFRARDGLIAACVVSGADATLRELRAAYIYRGVGHEAACIKVRAALASLRAVLAENARLRKRRGPAKTGGIDKGEVQT